VLPEGMNGHLDHFVCTRIDYAVRYFQSLDVTMRDLHVEDVTVAQIPKIKAGRIPQLIFGAAANQYVLYDETAYLRYDNLRHHCQVRIMSAPVAAEHVASGGQISRLERRVKTRKEMAAVAMGSWPGFSLDNLPQHVEAIASGRINPLVKCSMAFTHCLNAGIGEALIGVEILMLLDLFGYTITRKRLQAKYGQRTRYVDRLISRLPYIPSDQPTEKLRRELEDFAYNPFHRHAA